jgi:hypothetical protein
MRREFVPATGQESLVAAPSVILCSVLNLRGLSPALHRCKDPAESQQWAFAHRDRTVAADLLTTVTADAPA